ncbi:protease-4 [Halogranum gelatinilyticum]|uniref:Protease-4 n=1 Tax=Halogranum gelatinilyticum TaxID=660521 RepID=A0A1G9QPZ9_9EURY|nr:signal peptide peptidase SppA [Halogranum gelatinilyticum]SDM13122.1 protease-4 [Halogranum gelatinilyticum]
MSDRSTRIVQLLIVLVAVAVAAVVGWLLFYAVPDDIAELLGVLLTIALVVFGARAGSRLASRRYPDYNVAEVAVEGPISRDGGPGRLPTSPGGASADEIADLVEAADEDDNVQALLVKLDTPGGAVVPSDDIRRAAAAFDGPTVAYTTDVCASGGYWIASGCDELWAREGSIVGSIGVIGSRPNVSELADQLGVSYERFAAGKYKDAGQPLKEMSDDERSYLQGIVDDYYEHFVERVAEGRDMDPEAIRETEARVYLGTEALELGLVDQLGTREEVEDHVADRIGEEVSVSEFQPDRGLTSRLRGGSQAVAYALGAGVASAVDPDDGFDFRF